MQHVENRDASIEADEIRQREWPHRMIHAQLHNPVNALARGNIFVEREDRLVNHRHQYAV